MTRRVLQVVAVCQGYLGASSVHMNVMNGLELGRPKFSLFIDCGHSFRLKWSVFCCFISAYEDLPKNHRLYDVRQKSFPRGAHLIVNKISATLLHSRDSDYIVKPRPIIYSSHAGKLIKDRTFRHKRNSHKRDISHKIAGCCDNDIGCLLALCVVRH